VEITEVFEEKETLEILSIKNRPLVVVYGYILGIILIILPSYVGSIIKI